MYNLDPSRGKGSHGCNSELETFKDVSYRLMDLCLQEYAIFKTRWPPHIVVEALPVQVLVCPGISKYCRLQKTVLMSSVGLSFVVVLEKKLGDVKHYQNALTQNTGHILELNMYCMCVYCVSQEIDKCLKGASKV